MKIVMPRYDGRCSKVPPGCDQWTVLQMPGEIVLGEIVAIGTLKFPEFEAWRNGESQTFPLFDRAVRWIRERAE